MIKLRTVAVLALTTALGGALGACGSESPTPSPQAQEPQAQEQQPEEAQSAEPQVEIVSPADGADVLQQEQEVTGIASGIPDDQELWIFTRKEEKLAPQSSVIEVGPDGTWSEMAYVGSADGPDADVNYDITIQMVPKAAGQSIVDYLEEAAETGEYPGFDPPAGSVEAASIAVTRTAG